MASLEDRIKRLEDIEEIKILLIDYGRHLDRMDLKAYSQLFARDGEWSGGLGSARTPEGIREMLEKAIGAARAAAGPGPPRRVGQNHVMSNMRIEVDGDTATAWSRWSWVTPGSDGAPVVSRNGHYDDVLVREDGRWKFMSRAAVTDLQADPQ